MRQFHFRQMSVRAAGRVPVQILETYPVGLTVGHWKVSGPVYRSDKGELYVPCVSRCGVATPIGLKHLKAGRPLTCEACRVGIAAPAQRVSDETDAAYHSLVWEETMSAAPTNPQALSAKARRAWHQHGQRCLNHILAGTGYGLSFGWKVVIKDHHMHKKASGRPDGAKLCNVSFTDQRVLLRLRPGGSDMWFDVYVGWVRTDVEKETVIEAFKTVCSDADPQPAADPHPAKTAAHLNGHASGNGVPAPAAPPVSLSAASTDRLAKMRDGIDRLIEINRDMNAIAALKADAEAAYRRAADAEAVPRETLSRALDRAAELEAEHDALSKQADEFRQKLDRTETAMRQAAEQLAAAKHEADVAAAAHGPLSAALSEADRQLRDVLAQERERAESVRKAGDLSAILAAMERLG